MISVIKQSKKTKSSTPPVQVSILQTKRKKRNRRRTRVTAISAASTSLTKVRLDNYAQSPAGSYIRTLNDPFSYGPVRLGYGTMVSTDLATCYRRGSLTVNADGSFSIYAFPFVYSTANFPIRISTAGASVAGMSFSYDYSNATFLNTNYTQARVVSFGLRAFPLTAATAVPGVLYAGCVPPTAISTLDAVSPNSFAASPYLEMGAARLGATATSRPQDNRSFEFSITHLNSGGGNNLVYPWSIPVIAGTGFTSGTQIMYEVSLNVELLSQPVNPSSLNNTEDAGAEPSLTDYFPSVDSLWSYVKRHLVNPASFHSSLDVLSTAATGITDLYRIGSSYSNVHARLRAMREHPRVMIEEVD